MSNAPDSTSLTAEPVAVGATNCNLTILAQNMSWSGRRVSSRQPGLIQRMKNGVHGSMPATITGR